MEDMENTDVFSYLKKGASLFSIFIFQFPFYDKDN